MFMVLPSRHHRHVLLIERFYLIGLLIWLNLLLFVLGETEREKELDVYAYFYKPVRRSFVVVFVFPTAVTADFLPTATRLLSV